MSYPTTGQEVYVSLNLSNTMLTGIGKGTITREEVSASYLKRLFAELGEQTLEVGGGPQGRLSAAGVHRGGVQRGYLRIREVLCTGYPLRCAGGGEQEAEVRAGAGAGVAQPRGQLSLLQKTI